MSTPTANPTRQQLEELDALLQRMLSLPLNQLEGDAGAGPPPPVRPLPPPPVGYSTSPAPMPAAPPPRPLAAPPPPPPRPVIAAPPPPPRPVVAAPRPTPPPMPPRREPSPGDHTWNVPLPPTGGVSVYGSWPAGIDAIASSPRPLAPQPAPPPPASLRVTTIPSPDEANEARDAAPPMERLRVEAPVAPSMPADMVFGANRPVPPPPTDPVPAYLWPFAALDWIIGKPASMFGTPGRWLGQGGGKTLIGWAGLLLFAGAVVWGVMDYMGWAW